MNFLSNLFDKRSESDKSKTEPAVKTGHYINPIGCTVTTNFKSKELQFDKWDYQKFRNYCKNSSTGHTIYSNYLKWINECEAGSDQQKIDEANILFQQVKQEIYRGIAVPGKLSEEEICNLAAWIAFYSCNTHGLSGYCSGNVFEEILTTECLNCLLFRMIFGEENYAFLIDPALVKRNDWLQNHEIPLTLQNKLRIFVLLDKGMITLSQKLGKDEHCNFGLWNVINDQCFAVIRKSMVYHEIEDGYPLDVIGYIERLEPVEKPLGITEYLNQFDIKQMRRVVWAGHYVL